MLRRNGIMILLKSPQEIAKMEVANRIVAEILEGGERKGSTGD
jgi:methionine aminopeptidase